MLDKKTISQRRLGLIALTPMLATMVITPLMTQAAIDSKAATCKILSPKTGTTFNTDKNGHLPHKRR